MIPVKRYGVNKRSSAKNFRRQSGRTNINNLKTPMRGGWRL